MTILAVTKGVVVSGHSCNIPQLTSPQEYPDKRREDGGGDAAAEAADLPAAADSPKSATPRRPHVGAFTRLVPLMMSALNS